MITEAQMPHEEMVRAAKTERCGKCGGSLTVAWYGGQYVLRCGKDITHDTITRHDKQRETKINETRRQLGMTQALTKMTQAQMIQRIEQAKFPQDMNANEKKTLALAAITYGLDPLMGELSIYQGKPFVGIDGRYRKAQETGELDGVETRPAKKTERVEWEIPEGDLFYRAEVYRKGASRAFVGWGRVRAIELKGNENLPVVKTPQRMAEKRAEAQALRKAFHLPLPSVEDIGTPEGESELQTPPKITVENPPVQKTSPPAAEPPVDAEFAEPPAGKTEEYHTSIDMAWLNESLHKLRWTTVVKWLKDKYPTATGAKVSEIVPQLSREQQLEFGKEVEGRLKMSDNTRP